MRKLLIPIIFLLFITACNTVNIYNKFECDKSVVYLFDNGRFLYLQKSNGVISFGQFEKHKDTLILNDKYSNGVKIIKIDSYLDSVGFTKKTHFFDIDNFPIWQHNLIIDYKDTVISKTTYTRILKSITRFKNDKNLLDYPVVIYDDSVYFFTFNINYERLDSTNGFQNIVNKKYQTVLDDTGKIITFYSDKETYNQVNYDKSSFKNLLKVHFVIKDEIEFMKEKNSAASNSK